MMVNSRQKGKRGEKEARDLFRENGYTSRRGQQHKGGADSPDIVVDAIPFCHFEVKLGARPNIFAAMLQAWRDRPTAHPVVLARKDHEGWIISMQKQLFFKLLDAYTDQRALVGALVATRDRLARHVQSAFYHPDDLQAVQQANAVLADMERRNEEMGR